MIRNPEVSYRPSDSARGKMPAVRYRLFTIASVISLLLCLATTALWVRSGFARDSLTKVSGAAGREHSEFRFISDNGRMACIHRAYGAEDKSIQKSPWIYSSSPTTYEYERVRWCRLSMQPGIPNRRPVTTIIVFRIWVIVPFTAVLPVLWTWRRYRHRSNNEGMNCPDCQYNLTGNTSGVCPECGTAVANDRAAIP